jgi:TetR/AcrR family transcriptional regulator, transcriptional repressor for nem operon
MLLVPNFKGWFLTQAVMRDTGLTHGGFYKHFGSKEELLIESLSEAFREMADNLAQAAEQSPPGTARKTIVNAYLSPEHCDHAEWGCPLAALIAGNEKKVLNPPTIVVNGR